MCMCFFKLKISSSLFFNLDKQLNINVAIKLTVLVKRASAFISRSLFFARFVVQNDHLKSEQLRWNVILHYLPRESVI